MGSSDLPSSLCGDNEVERSSDVHLTLGVSSPVPLPFSLVSMGPWSSQWLFIKVLCATLLFLGLEKTH